MKHKLVDFIIQFMEEVDKEISEMKLFVSGPGQRSLSRISGSYRPIDEHEPQLGGHSSRDDWPSPILTTDRACGQPQQTELGYTGELAHSQESQTIYRQHDPRATHAPPKRERRGGEEEVLLHGMQQGFRTKV